MAGVLRFLIPPDYFNHDYIFISDVDLIFLPHYPGIMRYFTSHLWDGVYAGYRGPYRKPRRPEITDRWDGDFTRIAGGRFLITPKWFRRTESFRQSLHLYLELDEADSDGLKPCSFREYDEVMLFRMCRAAGLKTPRKRYHFTDGLKADMEYFDVHLGDFKFPHRIKTKLCVSSQNCISYRKLMLDPKYQEMVKLACRGKMVKELVENLHEYVKTH